ncbi:MAG: glycogen/starch/alpha-glucan phosphorylase [Deltaproteobacteria bacterium]|nr:glycogen/starch/alpha-glucan phosphorylase [Deltaproteobacteria bacterium]
MTTTAKPSPSVRPTQIRVEDDRTGMLPVVLERAFLDHLYYSQGKGPVTATPHDLFMSLAYMTRDRLVRRWIETQKTYFDNDCKRAYYLSAEFLMGRALVNNLISLGIYDTCKEVFAKIGVSLEDMEEQESDAGLGNGGLGRLAACFLDSMAALELPGYGYGIRYQFGIFEQVIRNGQQVECPEEWLKRGNPWEIRRPERSVRVDFYGRSEHYYDEQGSWRARWVETKSVIGVPYDTPVAGFGNETVNTLRLWQANASEEFDLDVFNDGDYERAVQDKNESEVISKVLYPNDKTVLGKELRLKQQYFFVRCAIVDIIRRHLQKHPSLDNLADKAAIQLNDTHPSIAIAELMRVLVDEQRMTWEKAWEITRGTIAYTNHTVLSEALERWSVDLIGRLLPRHLEIIFEVNRRFLRDVLMRWPNDLNRLSRMSLIEEGHEKKVRMANLAIVGSHSVNGVAALHSDILKRDVFRDFFEMDPERFNNKTNGVTPRRWLLQCNPALAQAITERIGSSWPTHLDELEKLLPSIEDAGFRSRLMEIKRANKVAFSNYLNRTIGYAFDPESLVDMQIKRIHEYKRQQLNILHVIALYLRARKDPSCARVPRTFLFGGKAAPGYFMAKLIIRLINAVSDTIAQDPTVKGLSVKFIPNYRVSLAERMIPACDLSEQISTAGMEASGTGNMKLAMNGALTIGTLDGANVEIREAVGPDWFFLFGLTTEEVERTRKEGYNPRQFYETNAELREVIDLVASGFFSFEDRGLFRPITDNLLSSDPYRVMADFQSYSDCHRRVEEAWLKRDWWAHASARNTALMGRFSSDRTIRQYASEIWGVSPQRVVVPTYVSTDPV